MTERPDVYSAIAHPVRRQILDLLREGDCPVKQIAEPFAMSRPAISQHLRILLDAELVAERRSGRERRYYLRPERLHEVQQWIQTYEQFWSQKLDNLDTFLEHNP